MSLKGQRTIHVVDDDPGVLKALCRLLKAEGYAASGFSSAQAFLAQHDAEAADCLLLDISMPGMSGPELQNFLENSGRKTPVIYLSGHEEIHLKFHGREQGITTVLRKPVPAEILFTSIEAAIAR